MPLGVSFSVTVCYDMCAHKRKGNTMLCCSDCEDTRMHVMCAVCLHDSAERECEQRQEDDEQASTISLGSYKGRREHGQRTSRTERRKAVVAM